MPSSLLISVSLVLRSRLAALKLVLFRPVIGIRRHVLARPRRTCFQSLVLFVTSGVACFRRRCLLGTMCRTVRLMVLHIIVGSAAE